MSYAPALDAYAFDVAVSFASEDREFVGEIVSQLTASNARVFCDSDFSAGIRGEELPGHLDRIYRRKTPHAVIFVSRFYAEKMWARYERRAVITSAHENSGIHILAVRLDDTALPGLRPAIGGLDARWVGPRGNCRGDPGEAWNHAGRAYRYGNARPENGGREPAASHDAAHGLGVPPLRRPVAP
jgi:hypothetical protein